MLDYKSPPAIEKPIGRHGDVAAVDKHFFSVVMPVFNRGWAVPRAIDSAVMFAAETGSIEIVLVDDCSTDDSVQVIHQCIEKHRDNDLVSFQFVQHAKNKGVCGAKNSGAFAASGEWLIFLDSDDELLQGTAAELKKCLVSNSEYPLHFFKCVAETETAPQIPAKGAELRNFGAYFSRGTDGEALPVIKREVFVQFPYDEDINGYESLAYLRIVRKFGAAVVNSLAVRRYYTSHDTRLSSKAGMAKRYKNLAKGHLRVLLEHGRVMGIAASGWQLARYVRTVVLGRLE